MSKVLSHLKPYRAQILFIFALVFLQSMADLYLPTLMSDIINNGVMRSDVPYIWHIGRWMLLIALAGTLCSVGAAFISARTAMGFGRDLRSAIFAKVEQFSLHEMDRFGAPSLITRNTNDVTQIQMVTMITLRMMIGAPIMMVGGIIMALSKDRGLAWILAVTLPLLAILVFAIARRGLPLFRSIQKKIDRVNLIVREELAGVRVIRAFRRDRHEHSRFEEANQDLTQTSIRVNRLMALMMPVMMLIMNGTTVAIVAFGAVRVDQGTLPIGNMMAFFQYAMQIMMSLLMGAMLFILVPRAQASADRIAEVLAVEPEIKDPPLPGRAPSANLSSGSSSSSSPSPSPSPSSADSRLSTGQRLGQIELRQVSFQYAGAEEPALRDISFTANPGEFVAIVGGTGSGKSTLVNLILRFYDVTSGAVLVDGVDVRQMTQEELRAKIGYVPQQAVLFSGTVASNIRYGRPDASDATVQEALAIAQAADFVAEMPAGLDSEVAQGGMNLSGGQKQRLAIARAVARRPEIYLFDDSFSALDFRTDARLRAALRQATADATVLIVAQRVSTVMDANRIIVLDQGRVVGIGTHHELMKSCPVYQEIVSSQLTQEEIA